MASFGSYFAALIAAYFTGLIVYILLVWFITREGRDMLMYRGRMNVVFYSQLSACWAFTAIAAAVVSLLVSQGGGLGTVIAAAGGALLALVVLRNHTKARHEQPFYISLLLILCIAAGTAAACVLMPDLPKKDPGNRTA